MFTKLLTKKNMANNPAIVLVFSGKRKSGKDFVVAELTKLLSENSYEVMRLSVPIKKQYALEHGLDFEKLLDSSSYKEKYRKSMIAMSEAKRKEDPGFFCNLATKDACKAIWIISDARRTTDIRYFRERYQDKVFHVRVKASNETRLSRSWMFVRGVDDAASECDLDREPVDVLVNNDGDLQTLQSALLEMTRLAQSALSS